MARSLFPVICVFVLAYVPGCSPYEDDFQYVPRPALAEVRSTSSQQATAAASLVSVIGVRREDRKEGIPESFEVRMRIENDAAEPVVFDPKTLDMTNGQLLPFPPPIVRPPGVVTVPSMRSANLTAFFPVPERRPQEGDLDSLELRWVIQIGSQKVNQSVNFRRVYPRVYYYGP
jgi:hypothetical protein